MPSVASEDPQGRFGDHNAVEDPVVTVALFFSWNFKLIAGVYTFFLN